MKTQINSFKELYIPKPCHQDWDRMTTKEQGKFCSNCQKVVYDFSDQTVKDFNILYKSNNGNICGRFGYDQVDQDYVYIDAIKRSPVLDRLKWVASFFVTFITLKIASVREGFSQSNNTVRTEIVSYNSEDRKPGEHNEIKGQVRERKSEKGIAAAYVKLYTSRGNLVACTKTDEQGFFYMTLSSEERLDQTFRITAEKNKIKTKARITKYSSHQEKISLNNFDSVILTMKIHSRWRRNILGIKRRFIKGYPMFKD